MRYSKWLAKLGAVGYDMLILLNRFVNWMLKLMGMGKISLSKRVKDSVKGAVKFINDFEKTAAEIAISRGYDFVVCGHIHHADMKTISTARGEVWYLNSGDWVENLTALEYAGGRWRLYRYEEDPVAKTVKIPKRLKTSRDNQEIFEDLVNEFLSEGSKEKKSE